MDSIFLKSFLPEIFLSLSIFAQLIFNIRVINNLKFNYPILDKESLNQTAFILICLLLLFLNLKIEAFLTNFLFLNNEGSRFIKILVVLSSLGAVLSVYRSFLVQKLNFFEFFSLFLLGLFSLLMLASSADLISAYLAIEMQALCFYILASFRRNSAVSTEAGLKYFISGSFISCLFLFGASLVYGVFGTTNFNSLSLLLSFPLENELYNLKFLAVLGCALIVITILFKVSAAPFHFWSPDVYEGAPLASTIVFVVVPKIVLFSFLLKWVFTMSNIFFELQDLFVFAGVFSVFLGTFFALKQKRLKRLVIYSSIAQVGFIILALNTNSLDGFTSVFFFLIIYILTSILVWGHVSTLYFFQNSINRFYGKQELVSLFLSSLSNLFKSTKIWAFSFLLIFFSVAGIPPLSGFFAKVLVLLSLLENSQVFCAGLLVVISSVSVFYYIRVVKIVFFEISLKRTYLLDIIRVDSSFSLECFLFAFCMFSLIFFFLYPTTLLLISQYTVLSLLGF